MVIGCSTYSQLDRFMKAERVHDQRLEKAAEHGHALVHTVACLLSTKFFCFSFNYCLSASVLVVFVSLAFNVKLFFSLFLFLKNVNGERKRRNI